MRATYSSTITQQIAINLAHADTAFVTETNRNAGRYR